jgi:hypothetical protein
MFSESDVANPHDGRERISTTRGQDALSSTDPSRSSKDKLPPPPQRIDLGNTFPNATKRVRGDELSYTSSMDGSSDEGGLDPSGTVEEQREQQLMHR